MGRGRSKAGGGIARAEAAYKEYLKNDVYKSDRLDIVREKAAENFKTTMDGMKSYKDVTVTDAPPTGTDANGLVRVNTGQNMPGVDVYSDRATAGLKNGGKDNKYVVVAPAPVANAYNKKTAAKSGQSRNTRKKE